MSALHLRMALLMSVAAALALPVHAQEAQEPEPTMKGTVIKGRAPVSNQVLRVALPRPAVMTLSNGLRLMVIEDHRAPVVRIDVSIPGAGGYFDPVDHVGLSQFVAAALRDGAGTRTGAEIAEQLERLAASIDVTSGMATEEATVSAGCLTEHTDAVLAVLADVLLRPTFPEEALARYKTRARAQLIQQRTQPTFLVTERLAAVLNGDHPSGRSAPTPESIDKTTRDSLVAFHKARYVPDHAVVAVIGDISVEGARKKVEAALGAWPKGGVPAPAVTDPVPPSTPGIVLVDRPRSVQTVLRVGAGGLRRTDPDFPALSVVNRVVGGGGAGRLFRHLREDKGYTYGAYSFLVVTQRFAGYWNATTDLRTEVTEPALNDLLADLASVRDVPIPAKELNDAKRAIVANFALSLEQPQSVLTNVMRTWRWQLPANYWDTYPDQIMAVTPERAQAMARRYLDPNRLQIIAVGDGAAIAPTLKKLGTVQIYDADGTKRPPAP